MLEITMLYSTTKSEYPKNKAYVLKKSFSLNKLRLSPMKNRYSIKGLKIIMFPIDRRKIRRGVNGLGDQKKIEKGLNVTDLANSYKMSVWNMMDTLHDKDAYTMYNWVIHVDRWITNLGKDVRTKYMRGDIVYVEWGAMNFGYEPSYEHPGVVIANAYNTVLIAPCSSQTFGKRHRGVIDLLKTDATGLTDDTGVAANAVRWISKNRITDRAGSVLNVKILDQIEEFLMQQMHFYKVVEAHYKNEIFDLNRNKTSLEQELVDVKLELATAKERLKEFKKELQSILGDVEELIRDRDPDVLEAYLQVAGSTIKNT